MNCIKCGHPLDAGLKCWSCGTQYYFNEDISTAGFINYSLPPPTGTGYYYPSNKELEWEM